MTKPTVYCETLYKSFGDVNVVQDLTFAVPDRDILALLGPSGCGKTTTLRLIAGLEELDQGQIEIAGQVVADGRRHVPIEKRRVGMVFQDYAIFPHLSVAQNIAFGLARGQARPRIEQMLAFVGLEGLGDRMPHELSGGQQQRVALARALAPEPAVLLLDEPFSNLDAALRVEMREEVRRLLKEAHTTAVFVTHDQEEALFMGDQIGVMHNSRLEQIGTPEEIFHRPRTRFVAEFMGQTDFVPGEVTRQGVQTPLGLLAQQVSLAPGTAVEVALRPDDVTIQADAQGNGRVLARHFVGIAYVYRLALENTDSVIHSWQAHDVSLPVGAQVQVSLDAHHQPICFHHGRALTSTPS
ncbi:MAG: ABC transporter ATP-binding protein [Anaerolineales bacterium]|nr:ABC transporter ATP-binding protein [Anaerolineales bacterium]